MAGFFTAAGFICRAVAAGSGGPADCHKGLRDVGMACVELQAAVADNVVCLEDQGVFDVRVIDELADGGEKGFDVLIDAVAHAGRVDADIR